MPTNRVGQVPFDRSGKPDKLTARWYDPIKGQWHGAAATTAGGKQTFRRPADGEWVLVIRGD